MCVHYEWQYMPKGMICIIYLEVEYSRTNGHDRNKLTTTQVYYTPGIYAEGYIVFAFPFVLSSVRMFVRSFVRGICVKVLRQSFSSGVYLSNYSSESIHIWTIVTLEGWHSLHDHGPQGPCPGVGLEVKI